MPKIFPDNQSQNRAICVTGIGAKNHLSVFMVNKIVDLNILEGGAQCFPLRLYEKPSIDNELFANEEEQLGCQEKDGVSDEGLKHFQNAYQMSTSNIATSINAAPDKRASIIHPPASLLSVLANQCPSIQTSTTPQIPLEL